MAHEGKLQQVRCSKEVLLLFRGTMEHAQWIFQSFQSFKLRTGNVEMFLDFFDKV